MWPLEIKFSFTEKVYSVRTILLTFILGIIVSAFLAFRLGFLFFSLILTIILLKYGSTKSNYKIWITGIILLGFCSGNLIGGSAFSEFKHQGFLLESFKNKPIVVEGQVAALEPTQKGAFIILHSSSINNKIQSKHTNVCFYANGSAELNLGSILKVKGTLMMGERANLQCLSYLTNPIILESKLGPPNSFVNLLMHFKFSLHNTLARHIREPFLGLAQGYILGDDRGTDPEIKDILERTSMTHIVAVSGFNIAILFLLVKRTFIFLHFSPRLAYILSLVFNMVFITLAGNPASAVRAGIMLSLILGAERLERMGNFFNILLLTAFVMIIINPLIVIYDTGFQLSFLASLGLLCKQIVKPKPAPTNTNGWGALKIVILETFWDSVLVLLFVSPFLVWKGGILSLKPLLANLPVLPLVPLATFLVIALLVTSPLAPSLAYILGLGIEIIIKMQLIILKFIASCNFLSLRISIGSYTWIIGYYFLLIYFIHLQLKKTRSII